MSRLTMFVRRTRLWVTVATALLCAALFVVVVGLVQSRIVANDTVSHLNSTVGQLNTKVDTLTTAVSQRDAVIDVFGRNQTTLVNALIAAHVMVPSLATVPPITPLSVVPRATVTTRARATPTTQAPLPFRPAATNHPPHTRHLAAADSVPIHSVTWRFSNVPVPAALPSRRVHRPPPLRRGRRH